MSTLNGNNSVISESNINDKFPMIPETLRTVDARIRLQILDMLSHDNSKGLDMQKTYPVNEEKLTRWVTAQKGQTLKKFASIIHEQLIHIPYVKFVENLSFAATWITQRAIPAILNSGVNADSLITLLLIPGDEQINKSYVWVNLLAMRENENLSRMCNGLVFSLNEAYEIYAECVANNPKKDWHIAVITIDDSTYSGRQMAKNLNRPTSADGTPKTFAGNISKQLHLIIVLPYATVIGRALIMENTKYCNRAMSPGSIILPEASSHIKNLLKETTDKKERAILNLIWADKIVTVAYFDHKMPNYISTASRVLEFGEVFDAEAVDDFDDIPNSEEASKFVHPFMELNFIDGCTDFPRKIDYLQRFDMLRNHNDVSCPPAHYKTLKYMFLGNAIDMSESLRKFTANQSDELLRHSAFNEGRQKKDYTLSKTALL
jgi:hypothetical protein